jgi:hypothetical protein
MLCWGRIKQHRFKQLKKAITREESIFVTGYRWEHMAVLLTKKLHFL